MTPTISIRLEESGTYRLWASSYGYDSVAGPRLFRAPPHPDIQWTHETEEEAEHAAKKLRTYLAEAWAKKNSKQKSKDKSAFT